MKALIQRVKKTVLSVNGKMVSEISFGLVVYLCVEAGDDEEKAEKAAKKAATLRIFSDETGKMNLSVKDLGGEILVVSQFTLAGDLSHGNRPDFTRAEEPGRAEEIYEHFIESLRGIVPSVKCGVFGADMQIVQHNDGPVTVILEL
ncbi:MAG: D-tyrosyl-tRNA(Tyr) deacylase [Clostridia bacterium]|nr:D-tyrosyl-tRNA(Tyr) deacylase [Clostridia bacterium]